MASRTRFPHRIVSVTCRRFRAHHVDVPSIRRRIVVAATLVVLVTVSVIAGILLTTNNHTRSKVPTIAPARPPSAGVPLTASGTADCSGVQQPGDAVALAATVNEGHTVCVTTQNSTYTVYFDGHMSATGSTDPNSSGYGTIGSDADHTYVLALFRNAQTARAAFCDGSTTLMHPLNDGTIRFFGLVYGPGNAFPQIQALTKGTKPYSPESGNCPPPSTPAPAVRHQSIGTPLRSTGPGDCNAATPPGDLALLSVAVTGGHTICVVQHATEQGDTATTTFLDGHQGTSDLMRSATPGGTTNNLLVIGTDQHRIILLAAIPDYADGLRLAYCDGRTLDLSPLNTTTPRFVGAIVDSDAGSTPSTFMLENGKISVGNNYTCPPPTTPSPPPATQHKHS